MNRSDPVRNLREFLASLRASGDLVEVDAMVDPDQEIAEIHRRVIAAGGPALLFKNVKGSPHPVATNLFGSNDRTERAFGTRPVDFVKRAVHLAETIMPPSFGKILEAMPLGFEALKVGAKRRRRAPVLDIVDRSPNLEDLPMLKLWPEDGGHFVTLPLVATRSPGTGKPNLGMYRMQRYDARTTGIHWQIGKGGGFHYDEARALGKPLPATVALGGPPALILAAIAPLPEGIPELMLASLLLGERLPMTANPLADDESTKALASAHHDLFAEAEFALIGRVPPDEVRPEGPFGDHYGYYSLTHDYPVFHCDAIARRADAIYPATVVGKPRQEDFFIGDYLQELLSPLFPLVMPTVRDLWSYGETGFHALAAAVVRDRYPREAMVSAFRILGEGQLSLTKFLLAVDRPMDLRDFPAVLEFVLERCRFETDLYIFDCLSMDTLDYAGPEVNKGSKGVLLGLGDPIRDLPREWRGEPPPGTRAPRVFCPGCLVLGGPGYEEAPDFAADLARRVELASDETGVWPLVVLCDNPEQATAGTINFLWTTFTRFEPAGDIHAAETKTSRAHIHRTPPIVLDARMKPWYPVEVTCDDAVARKVEDRWKEYFPTQNIEMGSSEDGHLIV